MIESIEEFERIAGIFGCKIEWIDIDMGVYGECIEYYGAFDIDRMVIELIPLEDIAYLNQVFVHELAHYVDIIENEHPDRRDIDGEVIAHAVEHIIANNESIEGIIEYVEEPIREVYEFDEEVRIDENDIVEVAERVRVIVENMG